MTTPTPDELKAQQEHLAEVEHIAEVAWEFVRSPSSLEPYGSQIRLTVRADRYHALTKAVRIAMDRKGAVLLSRLAALERVVAGLPRCSAPGCQRPATRDVGLESVPEYYCDEHALRFHPHIGEDFVLDYADALRALAALDAE